MRPSPRNPGGDTHKTPFAPPRQARLAREEHLSFQQLRESKRLVKALLAYCTHNHADVGTMFDLLPAFDIRTRLDFNFLRAFFTAQARALH